MLTLILLCLWNDCHLQVQVKKLLDLQKSKMWWGTQSLGLHFCSSPLVASLFPEQCPSAPLAPLLKGHLRHVISSGPFAWFLLGLIIYFCLLFLCYSSPIQKSSVAKTLQFESEAPLESVSEERSVERPIINLPLVLQPLIGQVAETAEEKYRLLEQRDKILRQGKTLIGSCTI